MTLMFSPGAVDAHPANAIVFAERLLCRLRWEKLGVTLIFTSLTSLRRDFSKHHHETKEWVILALAMETHCYSCSPWLQVTELHLLGAGDKAVIGIESL